MVSNENVCSDAHFILSLGVYWICAKAIWIHWSRTVQVWNWKNPLNNEVLQLSCSERQISDVSEVVIRFAGYFCLMRKREGSFLGNVLIYSLAPVVTLSDILGSMRLKKSGSNMENNNNFQLCCFVSPFWYYKPIPLGHPAKVMLPEISISLLDAIA